MNDNEIKDALDLYETVRDLAKKLAEVHPAVIQISNVMGPRVLLTRKGYEALFPLGSDCEIRESEDGERWQTGEIEAEGVRWEFWEKLPE